MIETERLLLREYTIDDFDALYEIMSDAETMQHYPAPFDETRTRRWIEWNLENYKMVPIERTPVRQFSETKQMAEAMVLFLSRREYHNEFLR